MDIQYLATPIYQRAMLFVTALHALALVGAFLTVGGSSFLLAALAVMPYIAALPGSLISLAVFKMLLAKVDAAPPPAEIYNSLILKALAGLGAGALATIVALYGIMGDLGFLAVGGLYLIVLAACTWLAVFQKRKLIYAAIQEPQQAKENFLQHY